MGAFSKRIALFAVLMAALPLVRSVRRSERHDGVLFAKFEDWAQEHEKVYENEDEKMRRFEIWARNYNMIKAENSKNNSYTLGMNEFGDLTGDEFRERMTNSMYSNTTSRGYPKRKQSSSWGSWNHLGSASGNLGSPISSLPNEQSYRIGGWGILDTILDVIGFVFGWSRDPVLGSPRPTRLDTSSLPESVDWELAGATSVPLMQGTCGSCYAFASVGAIEALEYLQTGYLIPRSVQQMVACSYQTGNAGCTGGQFAPAYKYAMKNGLCQSEALHYTLETHKLPPATDIQCKDGIRISGYSVVPENDELQLMAAVAKQPVAAQVALKHVTSWMFLKKGILRYERCGDTRGHAPDHAILIVGYGTHSDGTPYWKVKNSWGTTWGESGFFMMERFAYKRLQKTRRVTKKLRAGTCQIASLAMYPKGPIEYEDSSQHCPARKPHTGLWFMPSWDTLAGKIAYIFSSLVLVLGSSTLINWICFDEDEDEDGYHRDAYIRLRDTRSSGKETTTSVPVMDDPSFSPTLRTKEPARQTRVHNVPNRQYGQYGATGRTR